MQIGCPDELRILTSWESDDAVADEAAAHAHFRWRHRRGEWFDIDADDVFRYLVKRVYGEDTTISVTQLVHERVELALSTQDRP